MSVLHIDIETASRLDIKVGASRYSKDLSTVVTIIAWAFDDGPVQHEILPKGLPIVVQDHLMKGGEVHAWNAAFENAFFLNFWGLTDVNVSCTMQRSLYAGFPGKLADAADALRSPVRKDRSAHRLMLEMSKPKTRGPFAGMFWHNDPVDGPAKIKALAAYCVQDVEAERSIGRMLPKLPPSEEEVSALDRKANERGVLIDVPLVNQLIMRALKETALLDEQCRKLTSGVVTSPGTQTKKLTDWLASQGCAVPDVGKETIKETLETAPDAGLSQDVIDVLTIRQKVAKSSVKKLQAMLNTMDDDHRVRGTLQYYGANRTGRFSGRLIQPQNFPRPPREYNPISAINDILLRDVDNEYLRTFYGEPLSVISTCLRGCIVPAPGNGFLVYDLSQIEARVIAWMAGQDDIVKVFRSGVDVYTWVASQIGLPSRTAGKVAVLGLGFGTGWVKFIELAKGYGLIVSSEESLRIVTDWRSANSRIVQFWYDVDRTVRQIVDAGRRAITNHPAQLTLQLNGCVFTVGTAKNGDPLLTIELPSRKRRLYYRNIHMVPDPTRPGKDVITYDGIDQTTKKWVPIRSWGAKFVENIVQAVARDVIVEAALRVERREPECNLVLSVHDELIFEGDKPSLMGAEARVKAWMQETPSWASGLPIGCEGGYTARYGKK